VAAWPSDREVPWGVTVMPCGTGSDEFGVVDGLSPWLWPRL
jgi:hypothetical protein